MDESKQGQPPPDRTCLVRGRLVPALNNVNTSVFDPERGQLPGWLASWVCPSLLASLVGLFVDTKVSSSWSRTRKPGAFETQTTPTRSGPSGNECEHSVTSVWLPSPAGRIPSVDIRAALKR